MQYINLNSKVSPLDAAGAGAVEGAGRLFGATCCGRVGGVPSKSAA